MHIQVQKWGNSLAFRIPKVFVHETNLFQGATVDIGIKKSCIIVRPLVEKEFSLKSLLKDVNNFNIHKEEDFGERKGLEIW